MNDCAIATIKKVGNPVHFKDCPIGLFEFDGTLAVMVEYSDAMCGRLAYTVAGGEVFWGGVDDRYHRAMLLVQPCEVVS